MILNEWITFQAVDMDVETTPDPRETHKQGHGEVDGRRGEQLEAALAGVEQGTSGNKPRKAAWGPFKASLKFLDKSFIIDSVNTGFREDSRA